MELTNYRQRELTLNPVEANLKGILMGGASIIILGLPFILIWKDSIKQGSIFPPFKPSISFLILIGIGIFAHELIHGTFWSFYVQNGFKSIKFGVMCKYMAPYCHCKEPMKIKHYKLGAILPGVLLGFIPAIIALITGSFVLSVYGMIFTIGAGGDFLIIWMLRKEDNNGYVQDHPSKIGCIVYDRIEPKE
jgi:hypothetical protein